MFKSKIRELINTPTDQLNKLSKFLVWQVMFWPQCMKLLAKNKAQVAAAALSYHTIFGIVPIAIILLMIVQSIPGAAAYGERLRNMAYDHLNLTAIEIPAEEGSQAISLVEHIERLSQRFFSEQNRTPATTMSIVFVIWASIALLNTIERAFNNIWHVSKERNFLHKVVNYWAVLTLLPILGVFGVYVTTTYASVDVKFAPQLINLIITVAALFLLYDVLPNTRVSPKAALWGAMVAALAWTIVRWLFSYYVTRFQPYGTLYGAMALIPMTVLWIFTTWLIILFGLQLAYTMQHLKTLSEAEQAATHKPDEYFVANDISAFNVMAVVAHAFRRKQGPVSIDQVCDRLNIPQDFAEKILKLLVRHGLLTRTSEPDGYMPATEASLIKLSDIARAVDAAGLGTMPAVTSACIGKVRIEELGVLEGHTLAETMED